MRSKTSPRSRSTEITGWASQLRQTRRTMHDYFDVSYKNTRGVIADKVYQLFSEPKAAVICTFGTRAPPSTAPPLLLPARAKTRALLYSPETRACRLMSVDSNRSPLRWKAQALDASGQPPVERPAISAMAEMSYDCSRLLPRQVQGRRCTIGISLSPLQRASCGCPRQM